MKTLAERLNKETSNKGISEELFLNEMKKLSNLITTNTEAIKALIASIGNEGKAREERIVSLLSANERMLIGIQKGYLQSTNGDNTRKENVSSVSGNVTSSNSTGNGIDSKVSVSESLDTGFTFNLDTFKKHYVYRVNENLETSIIEFQKSLTSRLKGFDVFQTLYDSFLKKDERFDIRKIIPGIGKKAFWSSMEKAVSFQEKPIKHKLQTETTKDNTDMVSLLGILEAENISKNTLLEVIGKVKPHLTKDDFDKHGNIDNALFVEIKTMLGFNTSIAERYNKARIYISRLLA